MLTKHLGVELKINKLIQQKTIETANKLSQMSDNLPMILKAVFEEDDNRMKDQSEDEVKVLKQFENRKLNIHYNNIIKSADKTKKMNFRKGKPA